MIKNRKALCLWSDGSRRTSVTTKSSRENMAMLKTNLPTGVSKSNSSSSSNQNQPRQGSDTWQLEPRRAGKTKRAAGTEAGGKESRRKKTAGAKRVTPADAWPARASCWWVAATEPRPRQGKESEQRKTAGALTDEPGRRKTRAGQGNRRQDRTLARLVFLLGVLGGNAKNTESSARNQIKTRAGTRAPGAEAGASESLRARVDLRSSQNGTAHSRRKQRTEEPRDRETRVAHVKWNRPGGERRLENLRLVGN
jgi:hypothetical protein